jgi:hypothetical protein
MRAGLVALLLVASTAHALDVSLEPYRDARRAGAVGVVTGKIYTESRTPRGQARPMTGASVTLLPRSAALEARLQRLKEQSRESSMAFAGAAPAMLKAKEGYERALLEAGFPDLAVIVAVDGEGSFRIPDVPAGAWMVLAWYSTPENASVPKTKTKERSLHQTQPRLYGFQSVTVWLRDVTIAGSGTATLDLTDRNGWFNGVIEERALDAGR